MYLVLSVKITFLFVFTSQIEVSTTTTTTTTTETTELSTETSTASSTTFALNSDVSDSRSSKITVNSPAQNYAQQQSTEDKSCPSCNCDCDPTVSLPNGFDQDATTESTRLPIPTFGLCFLLFSYLIFWGYWFEMFVQLLTKLLMKLYFNLLLLCFACPLLCLQNLFTFVYKLQHFLLSCSLVN